MTYNSAPLLLREAPHQSSRRGEDLIKESIQMKAADCCWIMPRHAEYVSAAIQNRDLGLGFIRRLGHGIYST